MASRRTGLRGSLAFLYNRSLPADRAGRRLHKRTSKALSRAGWRLLPNVDWGEGLSVRAARDGTEINLAVVSAQTLSLRTVLSETIGRSRNFPSPVGIVTDMPVPDALAQEARAAATFIIGPDDIADVRKFMAEAIARRREYAAIARGDMSPRLTPSMIDPEHRGAYVTSGETLIGFIEKVTESGLAGWVADKRHADDNLPLALYDGTGRLATGKTGSYREDLQKLGLGHGRHGFTLAYDLRGRDWERDPVAIVTEARDGVKMMLAMLPGAKSTLRAAPPAPETPPAPAAATPEAAPPIRGFVERVTADTVYGWALKPDDAGAHVTILVCDEDRILAEGIADLYRDDLQRAGIGKGDHAFCLTVPPHEGDLTSRKPQVLVDIDGRDRRPLPFL